MAYITAARSRASRRRSPWNLLLIPCYIIPWFLLVLASLIALGRIYAAIHSVGGFRILPDTVGGILMAVGALFAWLAPSMIVANLLVSMVPAARRALDLEASSVPGTDRASAIRGLLRLSKLLVPGGLVLAMLGVTLRW